MENIKNRALSKVTKIHHRLVPIRTESVDSFVANLDASESVRVSAMPFRKGIQEKSFFFTQEVCFAAEAEGVTDTGRGVELWKELACFEPNDPALKPKRNMRIQHIITTDEKVVKPLEVQGFSVVFESTFGNMDQISRQAAAWEAETRGITPFPSELPKTQEKWGQTIRKG